eukprot:TRINITY_DN5974_c0_g1_i1.p1 TRINITY_DN5974_c0_g1~~TRINITY_DN5974_c0_g1_i1.p1  ORF type:complete len:398 (+),score=87.29 TRINITY_DN5974_c0_g1_i1:224-1417(+)
MAAVSRGSMTRQAHGKESSLPAETSAALAASSGAAGSSSASGSRAAPAPGTGRGSAGEAKAVSVTALKELLQGRALSFYDLDLRATVGTGTFGRVRLAMIRGDPERHPMAIKILKKSEVIRLKQVEHIRSEKQILASLEHPFIVNLLCTFQDEKRLFMLLEFVNGGELFSHLRNQGRLQSDAVLFYAAEIVLAFHYLHGQSVVYRDLKPENILISCEGHLKLTDFGFAKVVEDRTWTLCGTPEYLAPEIIQSKGHGRQVDWWALGVLTFEMLAGYPPFFDDTPVGIYQKVLAGSVDFPRHFDSRVKDFCRRLLVADRTKRLGCAKNGADEVKKHKWFKNVDWDAMLARRCRPPYIPEARSAEDTSLFDRYPESTEASAPIVGERDQALFEGFESVPC